MRVFFLILTAILTVQSNAEAACTKRPGATEFTLSQVMYHFGRSTRIASTAIQMGQRDPSRIGVAPIQDALGGSALR